LHLALAYSETANASAGVPIAEGPALNGMPTRETLWLQALVYAAAGRRQDAQRIAVQLEEQAKHSYVQPFDRAELAAVLGRSGPALDLLKQAYQDRDSDFAWINVDPKLDSLRDNPRFQALLRKANF